MARRIRKAEAQLIGWAIVIGIPTALIVNLGDAVGWLWLIIGVGIAIGLFILVRARERAKRRAKLIDKYHDVALVERLMSRTFWQGQTAEQLLDSLGGPSDIDRRILKTKKKEVWKYQHKGGNRFGLRITLDNDIVVGWDEKS